VLGAGGAARSVIDALARVGVDQIVVINRSAARAEAAAQLGARRGRVGDVADIAHVDLVVNATSVGMGSDEAPFDLALLRSTQVVADLVYHPIETALLRAARRCGATAVDGLGMLVHQAVLQQQLWTGVSPDPAAMRAAAEHELVARHG
jgi:shikimate dehydrogenase